MAAYAALISLTHIIDQIQQHPCPPIFLDKSQVEALTEKITFFQGFFEAYNSHESNQELESLRIRIADAAYEAEDIIESCITNQICARRPSIHDGEDVISLGDFFEDHSDCGSKEAYGLQSPTADVVDEIAAESTIEVGENISSIELYQCLPTVIESMDVIKKEAVEIQDKMANQDQMCRNSMPKSRPIGQNTIMVGLDDILNEVLDKLTGQERNRQIISIVGMGGIGKTTLARNVYTNPLMRYHFDVCIWVTISQEYNVREILVEALCERNKVSKESLREESVEDLGSQLYKSLSGRRYLIIMDDMWDVEACQQLIFLFPNNESGSRIVITTRLSKLALHLSSTYSFKMDFLDEDKSWYLLCKIVFGEEGCPYELKDIGKKIAENCKGLPLSIAVIGGLLAKSNGDLNYWEYVRENLNSILNLEDNEHCLRILHTSYNLLPVHLKPCFLYMGIFPEDSKIRVSELIRLWVAEGFLKPISGKTLEEGAEEYLMDLIDRNLVLVSERGVSGKIKFCKVHDLLRDLCLREARKENFICLTSQHGLNIPYEGESTHRRIVIQQSTSKENYPHSLKCTSKEKYPHSLKCTSTTRSLICYEYLPFVEIRLLRVWKTSHKNLDIEGEERYSSKDIFQLVNSRYIAIHNDGELNNFIFPSPIYLLWNLQTLIFSVSAAVQGPFDVWKMPLLRHVEFVTVSLTDPPSGHTDMRDDFVLWNLHTLMHIEIFKCTEEMVKRIPNVKKLKISYWQIEEGFEVASQYCLNNLVHLRKLECLQCNFMSCGASASRSDLVQNLKFPHSLQKLTLWGGELYWEDMIHTKIGLLPHLEVLKLKYGSFIGPKWETVEGQFPSLKYLEIDKCEDLEYWTAESNHFPCLEQLVIDQLFKLKEIPLGFGEIPTLQSIVVYECSDSAVISAKAILDEQEEFGNESLQVRVWLCKEKDQRMQNLESHKFQVTELDSDDDFI